MTPLAQSLLELDREASSFAALLGQSDRGKMIRERIKAVRLAAANVRIADLAAHPDQVDPEEAVRLVVQLAIEVGVTFPVIVGAVNSVSERRFGIGS